MKKPIRVINHDKYLHISGLPSIYKGTRVKMEYDEYNHSIVLTPTELHNRETFQVQESLSPKTKRKSYYVRTMILGKVIPHMKENLNYGLSDDLVCTIKLPQKQESIKPTNNTSKLKSALDTINEHIQKNEHVHCDINSDRTIALVSSWRLE